MKIKASGAYNVANLAVAVSASLEQNHTLTGITTDTRAVFCPFRTVGGVKTYLQQGVRVNSMGNNL